MAANIKQAFSGATNTAINFGTALNGLLSAAITNSTIANTAQSDAVDNTTNLYMDALVFGIINYTSATLPSLTQSIYVYAYGWDAGASPVYTQSATGTAASGVTIDNPTSLKLVGQLTLPNPAKIYNAGPWSVAAAFGGVLPGKWGLVIVNNTGQTLGGSGSSFTYHGVYATVT